MTFIYLNTFNLFILFVFIIIIIIIMEGLILNCFFLKKITDPPLMSQSEKLF